MAKRKKAAKKATKKTTEKTTKKSPAKRNAKQKKAVGKAKAKTTKKKIGAKKSTAKKAATKKMTGKKATTKKVAAKKATVKKTTVKKATAKKVTAKKATKKTDKKSAPKGMAQNKTLKKPVTQDAPAISVAQVKAGEMVPDFILPATGDQQIQLSQLKGKNVVLYFYPKDSTPGCTMEGHDFSRLKEEFLNNNTLVYGLSRDSIKSHESFKSAQNYSIDLLSDTDEKACGLFGTVKNKNMYGKMVRGIDRSTFVIDSEGRLAKEWRGVKVPGHAEEVLNFIKSL